MSSPVLDLKFSCQTLCFGLSGLFSLWLLQHFIPAETGGQKCKFEHIHSQLEDLWWFPFMARMPRGANVWSKRGLHSFPVPFRPGLYDVCRRIAVFPSPSKCVGECEKAEKAVDCSNTAMPLALSARSIIRCSSTSRECAAQICARFFSPLLHIGPYWHSPGLHGVHSCLVQWY